MMYYIFYFDHKENQYKRIWFMNWFSFWKCLEYMRFSGRYSLIREHSVYYAPGQNIEVDNDGKLFYL